MFKYNKICITIGSVSMTSEWKKRQRKRQTGNLQLNRLMYRYLSKQNCASAYLRHTFAIELRIFIAKCYRNRTTTTKYISTKCVWRQNIPDNILITIIQTSNTYLYYYRNNLFLVFSFDSFSTYARSTSIAYVCDCDCCEGEFIATYFSISRYIEHRIIHSLRLSRSTLWWGFWLKSCFVRSLNNWTNFFSAFSCAPVRRLQHIHITHTHMHAHVC